METRPIYMDNHSTTAVDPRVVESMIPFFSERFGNAASINHSYGSEAIDAVDIARNQVAGLLNTKAKNIIFTSGATESNNMALKGVLYAAGSGSHLIINAAEHKAILDPAKSLQQEGFAVTILPVDKNGMVDPQQVASAIQPNTVLVSAMYANNEVGTINPITEIGNLCRERQILFHSDAAQAAGKLPIDLQELPVDLLSLSAHKMYGPKGIGALFVRRGISRNQIRPLIEGGGHERGFRSGTLPVPLIVGFGVACEICRDTLTAENARVAELRDRLWHGLQEQLDGLSLNGHPEQRLPGNASVTFQGVNSEALMLHLKDVIAVSSGSACTTAEPEPSHVLTSMGVPGDLIESTVRFGLGRFNTEDEVDQAVVAITEAVKSLRRLAPRL